MAPFSEATDVKYSHKTTDNIYVYKGTVDEIWVVGAVPYGGYVMSMVLNAGWKHQQNTKHPDTTHVSCYFLRSATVGEFEVHVEELKKGFSLTYLTVKLVQNGNLCLLSQQAFSELAPFGEAKPVGNDNLNLTPPYPAARQIPIRPFNECQLIDRTFDRIKFGQYYNWYQDNRFMQQNVDLVAGKDKTRKGGLRSGSYLELTHPNDKITYTSMGFFADMFMNTTSLLPKDVRPSAFWYPTVQMTIEFKAKLTPENLASFHDQRAGLWSIGSFLDEGRHEIYQEMWTAPRDEDVKDENWREKQRILAITTQFAMMVPMEVNLRRKAKA